MSISCTLSLTTGQTGRVDLLSDSANPPTTIRATGKNTNSGTLTVGLNLVQEITTQLSCFVPAGHYVKLSTSGAATITLISQVEITID